MLRVSFMLNQQTVDRLKAFPARAKRNFKTKVRTVLVPELNDLALELMEQDLGAPSSPFIFGTLNSKRYYLWLVSENPDLTAGGHWKRSDQIREAFRIMVRDYIRGDLISLVNIQRQSTGTEPYPARFVYDPYATPGHINTGYRAQLSEARQILQKRAIERVIELGNEALREAGRGEDL